MFTLLGWCWVLAAWFVFTGTLGQKVGFVMLFAAMGVVFAFRRVGSGATKRNLLLVWVGLCALGVLGVLDQVIYLRGILHSGSIEPGDYQYTWFVDRTIYAERKLGVVFSVLIASVIALFVVERSYRHTANDAGGRRTGIRILSGVLASLVPGVLVGAMSPVGGVAIFMVIMVYALAATPVNVMLSRLSNFTLVVYSLAFASLVILPGVLISEVELLALRLDVIGVSNAIYLCWGVLSASFISSLGLNVWVRKNKPTLELPI